MKRVNLLGIFVLAVAFCLAGCSKTGPVGPEGDQGAQGIPGADGSTIYSGNGAPSADVGKVGDYYLDKSKSALYGPKTDKGWGSSLDLKGSNGDIGAAGKDGSQISSGASAPTASVGKAGDYYLKAILRKNRSLERISWDILQFCMGF